MKWNRKIQVVILVAIFLVLLVFVHIEKCPPFIRYSSVYTTSGQTDIHLYVQMNTCFQVDKGMVAEEIITEHQKINRPEGKVSYTLHLYRTTMHYRWDCKYDTVICDEYGAIICCE